MKTRVDVPTRAVVELPAEPRRNPWSLRRITSSGSYIPAIDGVRFLAILMVLLDHSASRIIRRLGPSYDHLYHWFNLGEAGVILFFALSGYILHAGLQKIIERDGRITGKSLKSYLLRRVTRLEPPYILVLTGIFIFLAVTGYKSGFGAASASGVTSIGQSYMASMVYLHQILFRELPMLNPPMWSLEIEVQFYLLAPIFAIAAVGMNRRFGKLFLALMGGVCAFWFLGFFAIPRGSFLRDVYTLATFFPYFLVGIAIAEGLRKSAVTVNPILLDCFAVLGIFALCGVFMLQVYEGPFRSIAVSACLFSIVTAALHGRFIRQILSLSWIATIGGMCYSIYLVHLPVMEILGSPALRIAKTLIPSMALLIFAAVAVATVFFKLVEQPCMDPKWPQKLWNRIRRTNRAVVTVTDPGILVEAEPVASVKQ